MEEKKKELQKRLDLILKKINLSQKKEELKKLEEKTYDSYFWQDPNNASTVMKKIAQLKKEIEDLEILPLLIEEDPLEAEKLINQYEINLFCLTLMIGETRFFPSMPDKGGRKQWIGRRCFFECILVFLIKKIGNGK